jgi:hypothetical protein
VSHVQFESKPNSKATRGRLQGRAEQVPTPDTKAKHPSSFLQVLEVVADSVDLLAIRGSVALWEETRVPIMGVLNSARMLDRAPVPLGSPCDFDEVREQSVRAGAVHAV